MEQTTQTVGQYLEYWLEQHVKMHLEPRTVRTYGQLVNLYWKPLIGHYKLSKLTPQIIQVTINRFAKLGPKGDEANPAPLSAKTVLDARGVLRSALNTAWKEGLIVSNPALKVSAPKAAERIAVYLSVEDACKLIDSSRTHNIGPLIEVALMTGLRLGEATGLTWDDVDFESGSIRVRQQLQRVEGLLILKGLKSRSSRRTLSLPQEGIDALKEQRNRQLMAASQEKSPKPYNSMSLVFTSVLGRPLDGTAIDGTLKILCRNSGVPEISFHKLRHTAATHMAAAGVPLNIVKDQLGHSQIGLTANIYSHAVPAAQRQASETLGGILRKAKQNQRFSGPCGQF